MKKLPGTIQKSGFSEAWDFVARKHAKARICAKIEKASAILGNFLFLALVMFLACGILLELDIPLISDFLKGSSWLYNVWLQTLIWLTATGLTDKGQLGVCIGMLYLIPFAVCGLVSLLIRVCYRPKPLHRPEGTEFERAKALVQLGKDTRALTRRSSAGVATFSTIAFLIAAGLLITVCLLQTLESGNVEEIYQLLSGNLMVILLVGAVGILFAYAFINYILLKLLKLLYICRLPKEMMYTLELYCEQCRPEEEEKTV